LDLTNGYDEAINSVVFGNLSPGRLC
jgi:hypothetical protein